MWGLASKAIDLDKCSVGFSREMEKEGTLGGVMDGQLYMYHGLGLILHTNLRPSVTTFSKLAQILVLTFRPKENLKRTAGIPERRTVGHAP